MADWRRLSPFSATKNPSRRGLDRSALERKKLSNRVLRVEPFEERILFAIAPQLISIIPNEGSIIQQNQVLHIAPRELVFRFQDGQIIDPSALNLANIEIKRGFDHVLGNADDQTLTAANYIGFVGIGEHPNEVVVRFSQTLPDDKYLITIKGALRNITNDQLGTDVVRNFTLDVGAQVVAVVPQPLTRDAQGRLSQAKDTIEVYFNDDDLNVSSATNRNFYELIRTNGTVSTLDDTIFNPTSVTYDPITDKAVLKFNVADITTVGNYRLRVGNNDPLPFAPVLTTLAPDTGLNLNSSFGTAFDLGNLGTAAQGLQSQIVSSSIDPQPFGLLFPGGGTDEPGHRDIPMENHVNGFADTADGVDTIAYNFQDVYGFDPQGNVLHNLITENQKERAREIFGFYSRYLGVQFVETPDSGLTIVTGDLRAISPTIPTGPGGVAGLAGMGKAIMDNAEQWSDRGPEGGNWFQVAMHEIGHLLGQGHTYDLPPLTIQGTDNAITSNVGPEPVFPGDHDIIHGQYQYRPDVKDIDLYKITVVRDGILDLETVAERFTTQDPSQLDTVISVYDANKNLIARNDDYYSRDSFLHMQVTQGVYYIGVTASGNTAFDPNIVDSGIGGRSQGSYDLRFNFTPGLTTGLTDTTGTLLDGDADGYAGGAYNFWFNVADTQNTIFVDKGATNGGGALGSITNPYTNIATALAAATPNTIVRIAGNIGNTTGSVPTGTPLLNQRRAYNIGYDVQGTPLSDGATLEIPAGVTVMVDAGAIFKMRGANIDVGTSAQGIDRSQGALQILGKVIKDGTGKEVFDAVGGRNLGSVIFTSYHDETIGIDGELNRTTTPAKGDWGGLVFREDSDREAAGIFLNYVNHADLGYGGGNVVVNSVQSIYNPIHLIDARPSVSFNSIRNSADAAMSGDPNAFEDSSFQDNTFTADYNRVGPDIHGNRLVENSINALFIRIQTLAGQNLDPLTVNARFNDTDIVHYMPETLHVTGTPGGPMIDPITGVLHARLDARLAIDPGVVVKLDGARIETGIGGQIIAEGTVANPVIFTSSKDDQYGAGGTFDTTGDGLGSTPAPGDWAGFYFGHLSRGSIDHAVITFGGGASNIEGGSASFNAIEIHQGEVRIANSTIQNNDDGGGVVDINNPTRTGRGGNEAGAIFVRGAQPALLNNIIRNNAGAAININANSLSAPLVNDPGRSTVTRNRTDGSLTNLDLQGDFLTNTGPLVRGNRLIGNDQNGMLVRAGVLTTQTIWDDTDIVHIVEDEIVVPDLHTYGGLRLQSSVSESLVVKLDGPQAGFTASGRPLDIDDRIGGTVIIVGTAGHPVVLTSIEDDTVGAGFDPSGRPMNDTDNTPSPVPPGGGALPTIGEIPAGLLIDNDTATTTVGHFEYQPQAGGGSAISDGQLPISGVTAQGNTQLLVNANWIFDYMNYVDVGSNGGAISLAATTITMQPTLISPDHVVSMGTFAGQNGLITWTVESSFDNGGSFMRNQVSFSSPQPIGNLRFINYLDEDVEGIADDILRFTGTPGQPDFQVFTLDGPERVGFSQSGIYAAGPGLVNATWDGWAADAYSDLQDAIEGTGAAFSPAGTIDTTDLTPFNDPDLGAVYGLADVTTAFAWTISPTATSSTVTTALGLIPINPVLRLPGGAWRSVKLDDSSNDRNVASVNELERGFTASGDTNSLPTTAQLLGQLAPNEKSGDDILRLGYEVHGYLSQKSDVDVYSFKAQTGTEVWLDIDRTTQALDSVVELVDANGAVIARSNNSTAELAASNPLNGTSPANGGQGLVGNLAKVLSKSFFQGGVDNYTTNPLDAGMRIVLPGNVGTTNTYYVRVRSATDAVADPNMTNLTGGLTKGVYQLQIRLRETDEFPGSTVRNADIRYATTGIEIIGKPEHSPLLGESAESTAANNSLPTAQDLGNLLAADRNTLSVAGLMQGGGDIDWYSFQVDLQAIQSIGGVNDKGDIWPTIFDIDYADGTGRAHLILSVFDSAGNLVYVSRNSNVSDDRPGPLSGADTTDLTRGSFGALDPFIGSANLLEGGGRTYYVAVSANSQHPEELNQFYSAAVANPLLRLQPVNSTIRIVEDHVGSQGGGTALPPKSPLFSGPLASHATPFALGDIVLFVNTASDLFTVNPFTGQVETDVTGTGNPALPDTAVPITYRDIAMRSDGRLYSLTVGNGNGNLDQNAISGNYRELSTGNGGLISSVDDQIITYQADPTNPVNTDGTLNLVRYNAGVQFEALAHIDNGAREVWAVGNIPGNPIRVDKTTNLLYKLQADGRVIDDPGDQTPDDPRIPTDARERGRLLTGGTIILPDATDTTFPFDNVGDIEDGLRFTITDGDGTALVFEFDSGPDVDVSRWGAESVRDGNTFVLGDGVNPRTFEFNSGKVLVVPANGAAGITNHATITITDNNAPNPNNAPRTFEIVNNNDVLNNTANIRIQIGPGDTRLQVASAIETAINAVTGPTFRVVATRDVKDPANEGRIGFINDTDVVVAGGGTLVTQGDYVVGNNRVGIPFEESDTFVAFGGVLTFVVQTTIPTVRAGFAARTGDPAPPGTSGDRLSFFNAFNADFTGTPAFTLVPGTQTGIDPTSNVVVPFDAGDFGNDVAVGLAAAINNAAAIFPTFGTTATVAGNAVSLKYTSVTPTVPPPLFAAGEGPGGTITGLAMFNGDLYAVSDAGGFYIVNNPNSYETLPGTGPTLSYIGTATGLVGIPFSSLSLGPQNVEGGRYANMFFATDEDGNIHAFDATGVLQPIFLDGATSIDTGINDLTGLAFSTLDYNLWHATTARGGDAGHGINVAPDQTNVPSARPDTSYYFGIEDPRSNTAQSVQPSAGAMIPRNTPTGPDGHADNFRTYDLPGGAKGSLTTDSFSLAGYERADKPAMYFTYYLETENAIGTVRPNRLTMRDAIRVFGSIDGSNWVILNSNDSLRTDPVPIPPPDLNAPLTGGVQELYDNTNTWRQARVDLSDFVGLDGIRLRFDFSTAGTFAIGDPMLGGDALTALAGSEIRDGDTVTIDGVTFEYEMGFTLVAPTAAGFNIADGEFFTVTGPGGTETYEFDKDGAVTGTNIPILITTADTANVVGAAIAAAIAAGTTGVVPQLNGNRVNLTGATDVLQGGPGAVAVLLEGAVGVDPANHAVVVHAGLTPDEVAFILATEIDVEFTATAAGNVDDPNNFTSSKLNGHSLQIIGHTVEGSFGLFRATPFSNVLQGDAYGTAFNEPTNGIAWRGQNNHFEGVYLDDFIIGFTDRGEMATGTAASSNFSGNPLASDTDILSGPYDLEIRRGTEYTIPTPSPPPLFTLVDTFDINDRLAQQFMLDVSPGSQIQEGEFFQISDGLTFVTFEFQSGLTLVAPVGAGTSILDGETFTLTGPGGTRTFEFNKSGGLTNVNNIEVAIIAADTADVVATKVAAAVTGAAIGIVPAVNGPRVIFNGATALFQSANAKMLTTAAVGNFRVPFTADSTADQIATFITNSINARYQSTTLPAFKVRASHVLSRGTVDLVDAAFVNTDNAPSTTFRFVVNSVLAGDFGLGDKNLHRDQGYTIIESNRITGTTNYGINAEAAPRTAGTSLPHAGSPRNLRELNAQGLVPGVTLRNNLITYNDAGGIRISGDATVDPDAATPFFRVVNNTIYGGASATGNGIRVTNNASPTLLNNIIANTATAISLNANSASTVVEANLFKGNAASDTFGTRSIQLNPTQPLFVDPDNGNFYLAKNSLAIDSSNNVVSERPALQTVTAPLGIPVSPILAPDTDLLGLQRVDDPLVTPPPGLGSNVFKDRGAIDRADFVNPFAAMANPPDNDSGGRDKDPAASKVRTVGENTTFFSIQLFDPNGIGIDDTTVTSSNFVLTKDGVTLVPVNDYLFSYDKTNKVVRFDSATGVFLKGTYTLTISNLDNPLTTSVREGIFDLAGNPLNPNQAGNVTQFTVVLADTPLSPWQNPLNRLDVSGDGLVNGFDVLLIVNRLNPPGPGPGPLPLPATPPPYYDVNGDNFLSAIDALVIVNFLNTQSASSLSALSSPIVASAMSSSAIESVSADDAGASDLSIGFTVAAQSRSATVQAAVMSDAAAASSEPAAVEAALATDLLEGPSHSLLAADVSPSDAWAAHDEDLDDILVAIGGDVCAAIDGKSGNAWDSV